MRDVFTKTPDKFVIVADLLAIVLGFAFLYSYNQIGETDLQLIYPLLGCVVLLLVSMIMGFYKGGAVAEPLFIARGLIVLGICGVIFAVGALLLNAKPLDCIRLTIGAALLLSCMVLTRLLRYRFAPAEQGWRGTLVIAPDSAVALLRRLARCSLGSIQVSEPPPHDGTVTLSPAAQALIANQARNPAISEIVISGGLALDERLVTSMLLGRRRGARISTVAAFMETNFGQLPLDDPETLRALATRSSPRSLFSRTIKRLLDLSLSAALLTLLLPLLMLVATAVHLQDGGPALFRQRRVGLNGGEFTLLKFRSMRTDAESDGVARWAARDDCRVTRFGRILRLYRLDELPQLINVLRGEMSLVGPRPERPEIAREIARRIPLFELRHLVPPGLTGWAQVNFSYGASVEDATEKTRYDLYYVKNGSIWLDLLILMHTVRVVMLAEGSR